MNKSLLFLMHFDSNLLLNEPSHNPLLLKKTFSPYSDTSWLWILALDICIISLYVFAFFKADRYSVGTDSWIESPFSLLNKLASELTAILSWFELESVLISLCEVIEEDDWSVDELDCEPPATPSTSTTTMSQNHHCLKNGFLFFAPHDGQIVFWSTTKTASFRRLF